MHADELFICMHACIFGCFDFSNCRLFYLAFYDDFRSAGKLKKEYPRKLFFQKIQSTRSRGFLGSNILPKYSCRYEISKKFWIF
jgi:hypothetical protein